MTTAGGIPGLAPGVSSSIRLPGGTTHHAPLTFVVWCLLAAPCASQVPSPAQAQSALPQAEQTLCVVDAGLMRVGGAGAPSRVFGVDVFRRSTTQSLPLLSGPVPADYKLGAGDQLVLILTGDVELAYTLPVTREGFILIPQVGQVFVSNLTLDQLRDVLYARLGRVYSG